MRLKIKAIAITSLTLFVFLGIGIFKSNAAWMNNIFSIAIIAGFFALTLLLFYVFIIRRIERLNQQIDIASKNNFLTKKIFIGGHDEITNIANGINKLVTDLLISHQENDRNAEESAEISQHINNQLQEEIIERKTAERELARHRELSTDKSEKDGTNILTNSIIFNEILHKTIKHATRHHKTLAIMMVSLDAFNETLKNLEASKSDLILKEIIRRFASVLRIEDILAKTNDNEFIILLNDIGQEKFASTVAEKILKICAQPMKIDSQEFIITATIGICTHPTDGATLEELLKSADIALLKAKQTATNHYQFFSQETDIIAKEYILLESLFRKAMHNNELLLYYQPKLNLGTANISGVEALMRWEHQSLGLVSPDKFIQLAEETGLSMQIGEWVLNEACKTNKQWQDQGYQHLTISVNLSPKQFTHPDLVNIIKKTLQATKLNPKYLELEITEKAIMDNVEVTTKILNDISATGAQISIDHFGTGYISISSLKQFPISILKIDKSFIKGIPNNPNDVAITNAFISLAHNLGMEVVAEGVETAEQVQHLSAQYCDTIQGYYLGQALSADNLALQLKKINDEALV